ncbi:MAG TPA: ABC transporter substrate-binding protein [Xanthobacteraceae bacterium]
MKRQLNRRDCITLIGGTAAWPHAASAQQSAIPVIGFLDSVSLETRHAALEEFRQGLNELGYLENRNVAIEYRWAQGQPGRLPGLAADLARRQVAVIVVNNASARAARAASSTIPIVFVSGADPVRTGLVSNLSRPGANMTGVTYVGGGDLVAKRLGLLHETVPLGVTIAVLLDPNYVEVEVELKEAEAAAQALGRRILAVKAADERDINPSFSVIVQAGAGAVLVGGGAFFNNQRRRIVALAARHAIYAIYNLREFVKAGGLMSYGGSTVDAYRRAGVYVGRILKGALPGELPVELPTKFELVVNLATSKALGLEIPPTLLARADEVIE